jgi:hypothetical protein
MLLERWGGNLAVTDVAVCTENLIRIDCVTESPNVNGDDRALLPLPDPVRLAVQVKEADLRPRTRRSVIN